ncbi:MAG TPA: hypothetical protein PLV25_08130, partial [Opitutales bacterium]|nr:hypothetical protein [Opitutales bacterium]
PVYEGIQGHVNHIQTGLDTWGAVPMFGAVPDMANLGIHALRGNWDGAGWSALGIAMHMGMTASASTGAGVPIAAELAAANAAMRSGRMVKALSNGTKLGHAVSKGTVPLEATMQKINILDFSVPSNKAVFYSGPGQWARATTFAERTGGMTIEMTKGGWTLANDPMFRILSPAEQFQVWQKASRPFAQNASGRVHAFIKGSRADRTFRLIEKPILDSNPNVYRQTYHY